MSDMSWFGWSGEQSGGEFTANFSGRQVQDLVKALSAGNDVVNPGAVAGGGFALRVESLDRTMKSLVQDDRDFQFMRDIPKKKADNTIQQFNQLTSVGNAQGIFHSEGALPQEQNSTTVRRTVTMRFVGQTRRVTHVMSILGAVAVDNGVVDFEARNGMLDLLRGLEGAMWDADNSCCGVEFNGFQRAWLDGLCGYAEGAGNATGSTAWHADWDTAIATNLANDMRHSFLTQESTTEIVKTVRKAPNYGYTTDVYFPWDGFVDFSKQFYPKERTQGLVHEGKAGIAVNKWISPVGEVNLKPVTFLQASETFAQVSEGPSASIPSTPVLGATASPALAGGLPGFHGTTQSRTAPVSVDGAGNYTYQIRACNQYGHSAPVSSGAIATSVGDMVTIVVNDTASAGVTEWYEVARSLPGAAATTAQFIFKVKRTAASQTITDFNRFLPGTSRAFFLMNDERALALYQLLPMMKLNLAQIDPSLRFCLLTYLGGPTPVAPRKHAMAFNIGPVT